MSTCNANGLLLKAENPATPGIIIISVWMIIDGRYLEHLN